jgi:hypothetical protein
VLIKHVDGGLFQDDAALPMDLDCLRILAEVCHQDWSAIEPAILGTLFERGLDPEKRSQLGANFTSKDDILLVVEPVLMWPLRQRWEGIKERVDEVRRLPVAKTAAARNRRMHEVFSLVRAFRTELPAVQVLDPASGSGNFLYMALCLRAGTGDDLDRLHQVLDPSRCRYRHGWLWHSLRADSVRRDPAPQPLKPKRYMTIAGCIVTSLARRHFCLRITSQGGV